MSAFPPFKILYVNQAWQNTWGYMQHEAVGHTLGELLHGDQTSPEALRRIDEAFQFYHSAHLAIVHYDREGNPYLDQFRICPVFDERGRPSGHFVGISSAAKMQSLLEAPYTLPCADFASCEPSRWLQPDLFALLDEQLGGLRWTPFFLVDTAHVRPQIVWASPAMEALSGFSPKELLALGDHSALYAADADAAAVVALERAIWQGRPASAVLRCRRRDGSAFWNRLSAQPVSVRHKGEALTCFCVAHYGVSDLMDRALARLAVAATTTTTTGAGAAAAADPAAQRAALFVDDLQLGTQRGLQAVLDLISHLPDASPPPRRARAAPPASTAGGDAMDDGPRARPAGTSPGEERAAPAPAGDGDEEEAGGEYGVPVMGIPVYLGTPAVLLPGLFPR